VSLKSSKLAALAYNSMEGDKNLASTNLRNGKIAVQNICNILEFL
jgi:hypothetical protein